MLVGARARRAGRKAGWCAPGRVGLRRLVPIALVALLSSLVITSQHGADAAGAALLRYPYLTDLVGTSVTVDWATDRSATTGSVQWGAVSGGACTVSDTVAATRQPLAVGAVGEYQWKAVLALPAPGTYCYRVFLAGTDLLDTDPSPRFTTQAPAGSNQPFSFAVFGDWGSVDATGTNPDQANLMTQLAASGARFALSVGDNAYPSGSQIEYGDLLQTGNATSAVFGASFWKGPGASLPLFSAIGNHGFFRSDTNHPHLLNWPEDTAVATSGGRYTRDTYCCVNGTAPANYPSTWYAFDAGNTRFYVLEATWADTNAGAASVYQNDHDTHWTPSSSEYQWLENDLRTHPSTLKFAVFHYPLYSDNSTEPSDTYLQGATSLEGLLSRYGVNIAFTGHAHVYQRNVKNGPNSLVSYVTGGGGAPLQSLSGCSAVDAYAVGWSYGATPGSGTGSACGAAPVPDSNARVHHFLLVSVNGTTVTVTPTDELGRTFDVQTYDLSSIGPPVVVASSASVVEPTSATTTLSLPVTLNAPSTSTVTVDYHTADLTATAPTDYLATSGTLVFNPGEVSKTADVTVIGDPLPAPDERFQVVLTNPVNATIGGTGIGVASIFEDDAFWARENLDGNGSGPNGRVDEPVGEYSAATLYGGLPHVFYYDRSVGDLRHSWWDGAQWNSETLDGDANGPSGRINGDVGRYVSATLYGGLPHVFYYDVGNHGLRHAWWDGSQWLSETLDGPGGLAGRTTDDVGPYSAVTLYGGLPHVFYYDVSTGGLRHAWWTGTTWLFETLDGLGGRSGASTHILGQYSSVTLYGGLPHVFYYDLSAGGLRHAWWTGSRWRFETLDGHGGRSGSNTDTVGQYSAVTLYGGLPHVFSYDATAGTLRHAWWTGSLWLFETLDGAGGVSGSSADNVGSHAAAMSYSGLPHVFYYDVTARGLRHAWWTGAHWSFETLDGQVVGPNERTADDVGQYGAVTLYGGQPHVWYYDATYGYLRHTWFN